MRSRGKVFGVWWLRYDLGNMSNGARGSGEGQPCSVRTSHLVLVYSEWPHGPWRKAGEEGQKRMR